MLAPKRPIAPIDRYQVDDEGDMKRYRTEIPNIVFELDLSPYAFRLYCQIKRVAGDDGACWQSARTMAESCGISVSTVSKAKAELVEAGLIRIEERKTQSGPTGHLIRVTDIWLLNMQHFAKTKKQDDLDRTAIKLDRVAVHLDRTAIKLDRVARLKNNPVKKGRKEGLSARENFEFPETFSPEGISDDPEIDEDLDYGQFDQENETLSPVGDPSPIPPIPPAPPAPPVIEAVIDTIPQPPSGQEPVTVSAHRAFVLAMQREPTEAEVRQLETWAELYHPSGWYWVTRALIEGAASVGGLHTKSSHMGWIAATLRRWSHEGWGTPLFELARKDRPRHDRVHTNTTTRTDYGQRPDPAAGSPPQAAPTAEQQPDEPEFIFGKQFILNPKLPVAETARLWREYQEERAIAEAEWRASLGR